MKIGERSREGRMLRGGRNRGWWGEKKDMYHTAILWAFIALPHFRFDLWSACLLLKTYLSTYCSRHLLPWSPAIFNFNLCNHNAKQTLWFMSLLVCYFVTVTKRNQKGFHATSPSLGPSSQFRLQWSNQLCRGANGLARVYFFLLWSLSVNITCSIRHLEAWAILKVWEVPGQWRMKANGQTVPCTVSWAGES